MTAFAARLGFGLALTLVCMPSLAGQEWAQPPRGCGAACSAKCADTDTNAQCSNRGSAADYKRWEREGFRGPGSGGSAQAAHDYGTAGQYDDFMKDQTAVCSILHALHLKLTLKAFIHVKICCAVACHSEDSVGGWAEREAGGATGGAVILYKCSASNSIL